MGGGGIPDLGRDRAPRGPVRHSGVERRERGAAAALIASVGVSLVLQNTLSAIFTTNVQYLNVAIPSDFVLGGTGLRFNAVRGGATLAISAALIIFLHVMLKRTTLGKSMRACADDMDLARTSGIRVRNVILWTWAIAGAFAAVEGGG